MEAMDFIDNAGISYEVCVHKPTFTAQNMAAAEHESGKYVAKPVVVKADGKYLMCVLSACHKIDLQALKNKLNATLVELAEEKELAAIFTDCQLGAEPPFGNLYGMETIMDKALAKHDHILFQMGTHEKAVRIRMADYKKLAAPKILEFSYH